MCLLDFAIASLVLVALMIYYRVPPSAQIAWLPLVLVVHVAFTSGVALLLSMGNLFYRDVKYIFELVVTVWMFATSVLYPSRMIGGKLGLVIQYNPLTPIIDGYRAALIGTPMPDPASFAYAALLSALLFVCAWVVFHRSEFEFAESL